MATIKLKNLINNHLMVEIKRNRLRIDWNNIGNDIADILASMSSLPIGIRINLMEIKNSFGYDRMDMRFLNDFLILEQKESDEFGGITIYTISEIKRGRHSKTAIIDSRLPVIVV